MSHVMSRIISAWQLMARRSLAHWRTFSSVVVGVLLASTIMSGTVIYFDALRDLALRHALSGHTDNELDILATFDMRPTTYQVYGQVSRLANREIDLRLSWLLQDRLGAVKTETFALAAPGEEELAGKDDRRAYFAFAPRLEEYASLLPGGRLPRAQRLNAVGETLLVEAIVPVQAAELLKLGVGDVLSVVPFDDSAIPFARVVISGLFQRNDPDDSFWYLYERALQAGTVFTVQTVPFFVLQDTYFGVLGPTFGSVESTYSWLLDVDTDRVDAGNSSQLLSDIMMTSELVNTAAGGYRMSTSLLAVIDEYDKRLFFTKVPMLVFLVLISVVVLYYVIALSGLLIERQRSEVALLRSRGAGSDQVLAAFVLEGATISVLATIAGPPLAAGAISLLGLTPAFSDLSGNALMSVHIPLGAYGMSLLGGLLGFAALMFSAVQASRVAVTQHRQQAARPDTLPVFQRYYLDVLLLLAGIVLFRQLSEQGSVLATGLLGEVAVNQMLLAAPALVLVAAALVLLRLFPLVMRIITRLMSRRLPVGLALGLWQMSRNPTHYARLSLLLILTAGLGVFAASFVATLERSFEERVLYSTGSDVRLEGVAVDNSVLRRDLPGNYEKSAAISRASPVYRGRGLDATKRQGGFFTVLAVDGESFREVAWMRDDFSEKPLTDLLKSLRLASLPEGLELPESSATIGVLYKADKPDPGLRLTARVKDARGRYASYSLGPMGETDFLGNVKKADWRQGATSLYTQGRWWVEPLTLVSISVHASAAAGRLPRGSILIDQITVGILVRNDLDIDVVTQVLDPFDDAASWSVLRLTTKGLSDDLSVAETADGEGGLVRFRWNEDARVSSHGIFYGPRLSPLPVLASKSFLEDMEYPVGEEILIDLGRHRIPVRLVDSLDYFPTLNPNAERFLVADLDSLVQYANLDPLGNEFQANEVWLSLDPGLGLDGKANARIQWDSENMTETEAAREDFESYEKTGLIPFRVDGDWKKGQRIDRFDPYAGRVIFLSPAAAADRAQVVARLYNEPFESKFVHDLEERLTESRVDPLAKAGWSALLFIGFSTVLVLGCVGFLVHAYVSFKERERQLAILRSLGLSMKQLATLVWLEQALVIAAGMALGTWMGVRLVGTIMPFLGHDDRGVEVVPPFAIEVNWDTLATTYAAMGLVFAIIMAGVIFFVFRISLHRILRLGEG